MSQYYIRRYFLDQTKGEGTAEDKYHQMNYLQVWDQIDILFMEYPDTGFMWIVDPTEHWNDTFFAIRDNTAMKDREPASQREYIRRLIQVEFYEPGSYNLTFIRAST